MTRDEAIRKVAALLRLAARPGTAGEAAAAAAAAEKLMHKYEIESASALEHQEREPAEQFQVFNDVPDGQLDQFGRFNWLAWRWTLGAGLARLHGCYTYKGRRGAGVSIEIVGRPSKVEAVRYLFAWLTNAIDDLTQQHGRGMGTNWRRQLSAGCVETVLERMKEGQQQVVAEVKRDNPYALQRIETGVQKLVQEREDVRIFATHKLNLYNSRSGGGGHYNGSARDAGRAAGRSINLNSGRQIGGKAKQIGGQS